MKIRKFTTTVLSLYCFLPCLATAQNLLTNGSFELGLFEPSADGFEENPVGSTKINGWSVTIDDANRGKNGNPYNITASNGEKLIDLAGRDNSPPHSAITQTISTTIGERYTFSMDLGTNQDDLNTRGPITVSASAGSTLKTFTHNPTGAGNQWGTFGFDFTAESSQTIITINGVSGIHYIGLDNVSVVSLIGPQNVTIESYVGVTITGTVGKTYRIQYTFDLQPTAWTNLADVVLTTSPATFFDPLPINKSPKRFYRVFIAP